MRYSEYILADEGGNPVIKTFHSRATPQRRAKNDHHHTECELSLLLTGRGVYAVGGREYAFSAGDMFLFGSNEAHCVVRVDEPLEILNIHFEPRLVWERSENMELLCLFSARNARFCHKFGAEDGALRALVQGVERELAERRVGYRVQARQMLYAALVHILREYEYTDTAAPTVRDSSAVRRLSDAMAYIDAHLESRLTLQDIAAQACMSATYFSSVFKKFNGISPWEYIMIKRVERAIEMLKTTDMTKLEIAERCGFSGSSNFYKVFYNVTGKRPGDYVRRE